jgi:PAS domain S-box-containing protein
VARDIIEASRESQFAVMESDLPTTLPPDELQRRIRALEQRQVELEVENAALRIAGAAAQRLGDTANFLARVRDSKGGDGYAALADHLAGALGADYLAIDRLADEDLPAGALALVIDGAAVDAPGEPLHEPLCAALLGDPPEGAVHSVAAGLCERFPGLPALQRFGAQSAAAIVLRGASGGPIGRIVALSRRPLADPGLAASQLALVAAHASASIEREQAAAKLEASEARWRFALEGADEGIWEWNIQTDQRRYSRRWFEICGYSPDDPAADYDDWAQRLHPDDLPQMIADLEAHVRGHAACYVNEHRMRCKDGSWKWVVARGMVTSRDASGAPQRMIGTTTDIAARRNAEERLLWSLSLQQMMASASPLAFYVVDNRSDEILYFNQRFCEIWGVEHLAERMRRGELKNRDVVAACTPLLLDPAAFAATCAPLQSEANRVVVDDEIQLIGARIVRRYSTQVRGADDRYFGRFYMFEDITDRKLAETALRDSRAKFTSAFEHASVGMALLSPEGRWLRVNQAVCELLGYTVDELLARTFQELTHPDDLEADLAYVRQTLAGERTTFQMEKRYIHRDGHIVWGLLSVSLVRASAGEPRFLIAQVVDITARKQAEVALRESEDKFSAAFSSSPVPMLILTFDGRVVEANRALCELTGHAQSELVGEAIASTRLMRDDVHEHILADMDRAGGSLRNIELTLRQRDGGLRDVLYSAEMFPVRGVPHRLGTILDVTERKRAQEALRVSTQLLEASQSIARVGGWELDLRDNSLFWTAETYRLHETSPATHTPTVTSGVQFYLPESRRILQSALDSAIARGEGFDLELEVRTAKGRRIDVRATCTPTLEGGRPVKLTGIFQDITDRKQAELTLRESEQRLASIVGSAMDAIITVDEEQRILVFNAAAGAMFRCDPADAIGQPLHRFVPERFRVGHGDRMRTFGTDDPRPRPGDAPARITGLRADGEEFPAEVSRSHVEVQGRHIFSVILRDISARLAAEAARDALEAQLRVSQKMEAIGTLASGIAHDFNNILGAIYGYTELARAHAGEQPVLQEFLDEVSTASSRAAALVRQILAFSRQEQLQRQPLGLAPVIQEVLQLLRAAVPSSISFQIALAPDAHTVLANATQIHQIVMNLGTNAAHAMRDHTGRMTLTLENCDVDAKLAARLGDLHPGPHVRLTVSDTGHGMDRATMERIFDPFFTTKAPGDGTGLGLSVVHGIVRSHEGAITVRSQPGEGTTFDLYFPAVVGPTTEARQQVGEVPRGHGERILFVDDEEALGRLGRRMLERLGYAVEVTTRPQLALEAVRADPGAYALVVTDLTMPELSGTDLAQELRRLRPDLPVLLTSGYSADLTPARMQAAGIHEMLTKPFSAEELARAIQRALDAERPA